MKRLVDVIDILNTLLEYEIEMLNSPDKIKIKGC